MEEDEGKVTHTPITISRAALRLELLEMEIRLKAYFDQRLEAVTHDVRALQEDQRAAKLAVAVAATTLATETERRREELELSLRTTERKWTLRGSKTAVIVASFAFGSLVVALVNAFHTIFG